MKTALVIGSSGLVGSELLKQLLESPAYSSVIVLNRKKSPLQHPKQIERLINFDAPDLQGISGDDIFCAIGTTIRKAGSKAAQFRVDCEYPSTLAALLKNQGFKRFMLVSSIGADPDASNFYLRTKGQLEKNLTALNYEALFILRPSILLGQRKEFRFGEKFAIILMQFLRPLMIGPMKKYRGVQASAVAATLIRCAISDEKGTHILESDQIA